jgi:hypothetical protein
MKHKLFRLTRSVLLTFLNELHLCRLDPEYALMIGEREMCRTTA